ncbi:uncharacterized protein LOC113202749 [Frankliniella occidentalis]|uniref:Uncharacterized protein LOC113202749 n=1 Tax=Frankliniella occidentalis TaxID=133901 RepID=A0A6J1RVP8_FRAOC|nr:uncharacterized protein LOC113202749 [Frankliniella occidentalis]XP_026272908.1 uncharacterized protein LOC113202749 [Frankliniella occidentalis]
MGVDLLRGSGGRSHFLVATFAILSLFLLFNWWSLSTDNLDLLKQIEGLTQHLKSSSSLLDQCRHDRGTFEGRVKRLEDDTEKLVQKLDSEKQQEERLESNLKEKNKEALDSEKKFNDATSSLKMCKTELESLKKVDLSKDGVIASMRIEKSGLNSQIQELKEQVKKLNDEINQFKQEKLEQGSQKKPSSSTASVPSKVENDVLAENEVRNIAEPFHADVKESERKEDHLLEKEEQPAVDERELEMQDNGDERRGSIV